MRIALIPPIPDLGRYPSTGIHLLLSHLLTDRRYAHYYAARRREGDYLILDNSAHEHGMGKNEELLFKQAYALRAQEVVVPDILFDARGTIEGTKRTLKFLEGPGFDLFHSARCPRLMVVPQAKMDKRPDWGQCLMRVLDAVADCKVKLEPPVIGISKDYDAWRGGLTRLIHDYVEEEVEAWPEVDVHCLGWPNDLWSLSKVCETFPWVRSTDSAKPFVYAKNLIQLEPGGLEIPKYPRRDPGYFEEQLTRVQWEVVKRNIAVFQAAATDQLVSSHYS